MIVAALPFFGFVVVLNVSGNVLLIFANVIGEVTELLPSFIEAITSAFGTTVEVTLPASSSA